MILKKTVSAFTVLTPIQDALPILTKCARVALTFGTSTAIVECSFSFLLQNHTFLHSTMTQEQLEDLAILDIERDLFSKLRGELETLVPKFAQVHGNSRIVLL